MKKPKSLASQVRRFINGVLTEMFRDGSRPANRSIYYFTDKRTYGHRVKVVSYGEVPWDRVAVQVHKKFGSQIIESSTYVGKNTVTGAPYWGVVVHIPQ